MARLNLAPGSAAQVELEAIWTEALRRVRAELAEEWMSCDSQMAREALWLQQRSLDALRDKLMEAIVDGGK